MLRIAVCDDSEEFKLRTCSLIERYLKETDTSAQVLSFNNGDDLLTADCAEHIDIIFLDIIMPLLNGMDTARELRTKDSAVKIIFLTSSAEFALESYEVKANGYLLKPVDYEKIKSTLSDCLSEVITERENIVIKTENGYRKLYFHDIEFIEAMNKKVVFHLVNGLEAKTNDPLYSFDDKLTLESGFYKCHRSYIVYMRNIDYFNGTQIITQSKKTVPIVRGSSKSFKEAYFSMMFD